MDPLPKLQASIDQARPIIAGVVKGDYDLPTPCTDWNVRQLINHMLGDLVMYRDVGIKGEADPGPCSPETKSATTPGASFATTLEAPDSGDDVSRLVAFLGRQP